MRPTPLIATLKDKSVDTFEQNKCFLSASFRNFKKNLSFVDSLTALSPFSMLKYSSLTLSRDYNIEKGRGGRNVINGDWKAHAFNETGLFWGVPLLLLSVIVATVIESKLMESGAAGPNRPGVAWLFSRGRRD